MLLSKFYSKFKNLIDLNPQKLSTRITVSYLILFIIVIIIFDILVIFISEQFLLASSQKQLITNNEYISNLCIEAKDDILKLPVKDRLKATFDEIKYRNSELRYTDFFIKLDDNHKNSYQPYNNILNLDDYNTSFDFDISKTNILFGKEKELKSANIQFIKDDKNEFLYLFSLVPLSKDYIIELTLIKDINGSISFIQILTLAVIVVNIIGFLLLLIIGKLTTKRALKPLKSISNIAENITAKKLSQRMPESNSGDELDILVKALNQMIERLETSFNAQNRFVSDASHELRIPLTVIQGYVEILDSWGTQDQDILRESISSIKQETHNMHSLVEKLLFLARIDNKRLKLDFEYFDANALLHRVYSDFTIISPNHNFVIENNDECKFYADENLILQLLRITIENSIKYTDNGKTISLGLTKHKNHIEFKVKDEGIGIPKNEISKICNRFYRVDTSRTKQTGGTGLGLSIAKSIVKLHSGYIKVKSDLGQGTDIRYIFPIRHK